MERAALDNNSFTNILKNTDLVSHRKDEEKKNPYYDGKYNRYKKNVKYPKVDHPEEKEKNVQIRSATNKFVNQEINRDEYKKLLKSQGVNPELDSINKLIQNGNVAYTKLINTIAAHENDTTARLRSFKVKRFDEEEPGYDNAKNLMVNDVKDKKK